MSRKAMDSMKHGWNRRGVAGAVLMSLGLGLAALGAGCGDGAPATDMTMGLDMAQPDLAPACQTDPRLGHDWRDAVLYFVFVDRFRNGDPTNDVPAGIKAPADWQGGDWAGVRQKIADGWFTSLGVNALWITVPTDSTEATEKGDDGEMYTGYHGYWPRDLGRAERRFGAMTELKALVAEAHAKGIKVILDYAMNHVHKDSPVYLQHKGDGWFHPLQLPTGVECVCGGVCGWNGPNKKRCWFTEYLPDFDFANADARKYSLDNVIWWLKETGADGLRVDAVKHIELEWVTELRTRLTKEVEPVTKQHVLLLGETFSAGREDIKTFVDPCTMLDGQFDFPLRVVLNRAILIREGGSMKELAQVFDENEGYYGEYSVMSTFVGNHDVPRSIHFAQDKPQWTDPWALGREAAWSKDPLGKVPGTSAYERMATAMAVLMTNRGIPLLYYGDEIGTPGVGDPDNRRPMEWDATKYTDGQKLLLERLRKLGTIRAAHPALRRGVRTTLSVDDDTWAYKMVAGSDTVYVAINRSDAPKTVAGLPAGTLSDAMTGESVTGPGVTVTARSARVMTAK